MPELSRFYGIVIVMWPDEQRHLGRPHFHASYAGDWASIAFDPPELLAGELPPNAHRLVVRWALAHQAELLDNWKRVRRGESTTRIPPLP